MGRRKTLTDAQIAKLSSRPKPYTVPDPELPGHYVRVRPTGAKVFVAVARAPSGKQVWHTIGPASLYSIAESRGKAREAIKFAKERTVKALKRTAPMASHRSSTLATPATSGRPST